jgi:hypothetical protein
MLEAHVPRPGDNRASLDGPAHRRAGRMKIDKQDLANGKRRAERLEEDLLSDVR